MENQALCSFSLWAQRTFSVHLVLPKGHMGQKTLVDPQLNLILMPQSRGPLEGSGDIWKQGLGGCSRL